MGGFEASASAGVEPPVKYHPCSVRGSNPLCGIAETVAGGQFDWGGRLLKGNGGAQRSPQHGRQPCVECKGIRGPDCEADRPSRGESRA